MGTLLGGIVIGTVIWTFYMSTLTLIWKKCAKNRKSMPENQNQIPQADPQICRDPRGPQRETLKVFNNAAYEPIGDNPAVVNVEKNNSNDSIEDNSVVVN